MNFSKFRFFSLTLFLLSIGFVSEAQSITISSPITNSTNSTNNLNVGYSISGEGSTISSVKLAFTCSAGPCLTASMPSFVLNMISTAAAPGTFTVTSDLTASAGTFTTTATTFNDGTYTIQASYVRFDGSPRTSGIISNVTFDATTLAPQLISPASNSASTTPMAIRLTLGEPALPGSVNLTFTNVAGTYTNTLNVASGALTQTFSLNTSALVDGINIASATYSTTLPDDTYNVTLSYRDGYGHPAASATSSNVVIQTVTPAFVVLSPTTGTVFSSTNSPTFTYFFPVASSAASLTLTPGAYTYAIPAGVASGTYSFTISNNLPTDGTYTATITYSDIILNPSATSSPISIKFDRVTTSPSLYSPAANSPYASVIPVNLTLSEAYQPGSAKLVFTNAAGTFSNSLTLLDNVLSQTITLVASNLSLATIASSSLPTLPDDTYSVTLSYRDIYGNPASSVTNTNVLLQSRTPRPSLTAPANGFVFSSSSSPTFTYNLPSAAFSGTAELNLTPGYTYSLTNQAVGSNTYTITSNLPVDGTYTATVGYQDFLGNAPSYSAGISLTFDRVSAVPSLSSPLSNSVVTGIATITYVLPEPALAGTKRLTFSQNGTAMTTLTLSDVSTNTVSLNLKNLVSNPSTFVALTGTTNIPDGTYSVTFSYQDQYGNPGSSAFINLTIDSQTLAPRLNSPTSGSSYTTQLPISLTLGEAYQPGSAKLIFTNSSGNYSNTLTLVDNVVSQTFTLVASNLSLATNITSSSLPTLPDDTYNLTLTYKDAYGNPANSMSISGVLIQGSTPTPALTSPTNGTVFSRASNLVFSYNLPSAPLSGTAVLTLSPGYSYSIGNAQTGTYTITSNIPADGTYTATISYQDFLGNPLATSAPVSIKFQRSTLTPSISSPANNTYFSSYMLFKGSLPASNLAGSKKLSIAKNNAVVSTIILNNTRTDSLYFNLNRLSESGSAVQSIVGVDSLTDGVYTLTLSYQDSYGNPAAASNSVTITKDSSPLIGVLSHTDNVVFGTFTETLTFNKPVVEISPNPIIPNLISNSPSATLGSLTANATNTVYTFRVTPLKQGMIKLQAPYQGVARDLAGNISQIIAIDSIQYVDTTIIVKPLIAGIATFCQGDSISLTSSVANSYLWSTGATSRSIVVKQAGTYNVKTTYANRVKGLSDNAIIVVKPTPATPTLTRDLANNLVSSNASGNKWYKDGVSISDTTKLIKPVSGSTYTVKTVVNGCSSPLSSPYVYLITEIVRLNSVEFIKLAPNPFVNQLTIDFSVGGYQQLNVEVVEISTGISVFSKQGLVAGSAIDLGQLSSGTYIIRVSSADAKIAEQCKVIKL